MNERRKKNHVAGAEHEVAGQNYSRLERSGAILPLPLHSNALGGVCRRRHKP